MAAAVGALSAAVGRRELLAHAAGVRGRQIVTAARTADVGPAQLWRAARQLTQFDVRNTPPPRIPCAVIVLTDDRRMPPGLQRALARYLGCPHVDVAADHDAPVRQTARFCDGVQTALTMLRRLTPTASRLEDPDDHTGPPTAATRLSSGRVLPVSPSHVNSSIKHARRDARHRPSSGAGHFVAHAL